MTTEIFITTENKKDMAMLIVDGSNVACIEGIITEAVSLKSDKTVDVIAYDSKRNITGQFNNIKSDWVITDKRVEIKKLESELLKNKKEGF